jgi:SAM-dependent methyltransferase
MSFLYKLLEIPVFYSLSQMLLAPGSGILLKNQYLRIFGKSRGIVLDVGCGPALTTPQPDGLIVGADINPHYVEKYTGIGIDTNPQIISDKLQRRIRFGFVSSADFLPFDDSVFDESRSVGLLHHLHTESATNVVKEMIRCTRPGDYIIILDNVWPHCAICRPLAWLTRWLDRGKWVRTEDKLLDLVNSAYQGRWEKQRFTYSFTGLEMILLRVQKSIDKN